jgi:hypothetical protein
MPIVLICCRSVAAQAKKMNTQKHAQGKQSPHIGKLVSLLAAEQIHHKDFRHLHAHREDQSTMYFTIQ